MISAKTFQDTVTYQAKAAIGRLCICRLTKRPIFIFSTRRSGSTLLMNMLYSQPGVDFVYEPLALWRYHPHRHRLPQPDSDIFVTLNHDEKALLRSYFDDLLAGRIRFQHQWNPLDPDFSFMVDRLVIKEINANPLIDWFSQNFDIDVIYLIRHPIPSALSIMRKGWRDLGEVFLRNEDFCKSYLDKGTTAFCSEILNEGSTLEKHALEWCLHNLVPLTSCHSRSWLTITYEELVLRPQEMSQMICHKLGLEDPERMLKAVFRPVKHAAQSSKRDIRGEGPGSLSKRWIREVDAKEVNRVSCVLDAFGVEVYGVHSPYPKVELCHFGPLGPPEDRGRNDGEE